MCRPRPSADLFFTRVGGQQVSCEFSFDVVQRTVPWFPPSPDGALGVLEALQRVAAKLGAADAADS